MSENSRPRVFLGTIRARMLFIFALTLGVLALVASVSVLVMQQVQSIANEFIVQDFPRSQRVRDLNHLVEGVALSAQRLSHARTKADLQESFDQIDGLLLRLDITADELSRRGVDRETLQILRQLQLVRSEAQLGFQLRGVALDLASRLQQVRTEGLEWNTRVATLARPDGLDAGTEASLLSTTQRQAVWRSTQGITTLLARDPVLEDAGEDQEQAQIVAAIAALEAIRKKVPAADTEHRIALQHLVDVDWSQYFAQRRRQEELTQTSETVLQDLQGTVQSVVGLLDGYTRGLLTGFDRRKARVLSIGRGAVLLIVLVSLVGAVAIAVVQRELVMRGFSRRMDVISEALARLPTSPEDTRVSVVGSDEIATMARRLEVLLQKALQIQVMVTTDELTQVNNRRSFFQLTAIQRKQAARSRRTDSLLMLDLDFFKLINDTHGHDVGDDVLRAIAQTCLGCLRESDTLARMGGEEFCVYCPDTSVEAGRKLAERLCATIRRLDLDVIQGPVTLSVGLVEIPPDAASLTPWLKLADQALYAAKAQGRDRVVVANPESMGAE
jgi:diguanylate cyclase (GGDEF)-like protein